MIVSITIVRYPFWGIPLAILSMILLRIPLFFQKKLYFYKLVGCGKNGTFDIMPDFKQWGLLAVWESVEVYEHFEQSSWVHKWWQLFTISKKTLLCEPLESNGKWDEQEPFGIVHANRSYEGKMVILTRASIYFTKVFDFWQNVPAVAQSMQKAKGLICSVGIGEVPLFRQATISVWESAEDVRNFAYKRGEHAEVIKKTRQRDWYSEELFARFKLIKNFNFFEE